MNKFERRKWSIATVADGLAEFTMTVVVRVGAPVEGLSGDEPTTRSVDVLAVDPDNLHGDYIYLGEGDFVEGDDGFEWDDGVGVIGMLAGAVEKVIRKYNGENGSDSAPSYGAALDDSFQIDIADGDLRIDTYRASGAGGQHVNRTDSAVRITHLPTGVVVQCQNERSQHKNKAHAMKLLQSRLYEEERRRREEAAQVANAEKADIGWGSQ